MKRARRAVFCLLLIGEVGCGEVPPAPTRAEQVRLAEEALKGGRYVEAAAAYASAAANGPPDGMLLKKQAEALSSAWKFVDATDPARRAADLLPDDVEAQLLAATVLLRRSSFDEVMERMEVFLTRQPGNVEAIIALANARARLTNSSAALVAFLRARDEDAYGDMIGTIRKGTTRWTDLAAEQAFQEAMKVSPNDVAVQMAMANFLFSAGRADESALVLERVAEKYPNRARANHALGVYYMRRDRLDEAERFLKRATAGDHDERSVAVVSLADLYMDTMREDRARALLESQTSENEDTEISMRLARLELRASLRNGAVRRLDTIIAREPKATDAAVLKAQVLLADGALDQAVTLARSVVAAAPAFAEARSTLGQALLLAGDKEGAFDQFAEAVRLSPGAGTQVTEFTRLALVLERRKEALAFARDAARLNPNDPRAAELPARAFVLARDYTAAEQELVTLMRRTPVPPNVHALFGQVKAAQGNADAAKAAFAQALALAPDSLEAVIGMALLEVRSDLGAAARGRVEKALAGHPRDSDYLQAAAQVYAAVDDQPRADAMLREVLALDRANLTAALSLLTPAFTRQYPDEARRVLEQLLEIRPRAIEARYRLGQLYEQIGRTDAAARQYQAVLVEAPRAETEWIRTTVLTRSRALEATVTK